MIIVEILDESRVNLIKCLVFFLNQELFADRTKKPLYFGPALGTPGRRVGLLHGQIGAYDFQMTVSVNLTPSSHEPPEVA